MATDLFPERIETERLLLRRLSPAVVDVFDLYEFVSRDDWRGAATEHMPWFRFDRLDEVADFVETADEQWRDGDAARYLIYSKDAGGDLVGTTAYGPEWE
ncbi:MAG: N-acetyltransferase, partial [Halobacteriales archaeon]